MKKTNWVSFKTILRKELIRIVRIWPQTFIPAIITTALYFLIFGSIIGPRIDMFEDFSYIQFIIPGLMMMAVISNSYINTVSSFFGAKFQKSIEEILITPTPAYIIVLGYVLAGMFRGVVTGVIIAIVSYFFTQMPIQNIGIIMFALVIASALFGLAGLLNGMVIKGFDETTWVPTFVITPLTYLGGVFYPLNLLPDFWQKVSYLNPILYIIDLFRYGFLGITNTNIEYAAIILIIITAILFFSATLLIKKGVGLRN